MANDNYHEKNTKIIATISDRRCDTELLHQLYRHGMNVVRLNSAHQDRQAAQKVVDAVRLVSDQIAILVDTKGPEIRTRVQQSLAVEEGQTITLGAEGSTAELCVSYDQIAADLPLQAKILIDDGQVQLEVVSKAIDLLTCKVCNSGQIQNKKSVNIPGINLTLPSLTDKDVDFIKYAVEQKLDFIAHSFVRNKDDVLAVQSILDEYDSPIKIIAKVENREGINNIEEILDVVAGVMVARGDLGIEVPACEVPLMQKQVIEACLQRAKPVIVATHMLESMIASPRATRAEVSDIANAILDGASAIMLSGETAYGKYPVDAVRTMSEIALHLHSKKLKTNPLNIEPVEHSVRKYLAKYAVDIALEFDATAIIVPSESGETARTISAMRARKPIFAPCYDATSMRQLALSHGIRPSLVSTYNTTDEMVYGAINALLTRDELAEDNLIVVVIESPRKIQYDRNCLEVGTVKELLKVYGSNTATN